MQVKGQALCEDATVIEQTLLRARAGDEDAFRELTESYERELQLHIYRIVGSTQDAEDLLQETMLAAWRALEQFEGGHHSVPGCTGSPPTAHWMPFERTAAVRKVHR